MYECDCRKNVCFVDLCTNCLGQIVVQNEPYGACYYSSIDGVNFNKACVLLDFVFKLDTDMLIVKA